ncbi:MAG: ATP-binding cassette, subfamily bacterial PglK [Acidobacteriota bacterium]
MLARADRMRWMTLAPLGVLAATLEGLAGTLVFALLTTMLQPGAGSGGGGRLAGIIRLQITGVDEGRALVTLAACAAVVHVSKNVLLVILAWWRMRIVAADSAALATRLLRAYMTAPWPFHLRRGSAGLIENVRDSTRPFFGVFEAASSVMTEGAVMLALCAVALAAAPLAVTTAAMILTVAIALALRLGRRAQHRAGARHFELGEALYRHLQHSLGALKEVRILGRAQFFIDAFARDARAGAALEARRGVIDAIPRLLLETMFVGGLLALIVIYGAHGDRAVLPVVSLYAYAGFRLVPAAHRITQETSRIRWSLSASESLARDLRQLDEAERCAEMQDRLEVRDRIDAAGVAFTYEGAPTPVLRDVTFSVGRGESVAIVGVTGAGKTTLVEILIGLLVPSSGRIAVDGVSIEGREAAWQRSIGYVPQAPFLLDDTLRHNIALGVADAHIDPDALAAAVTIAHLDAVIAALPDGLDTAVGERGARLSGGERQRVAIARALYSRPALLIFDEATSSLDPATEREMAAALDRLRGTRTIVVVAHRLTTIERCDRVLLLENGCIAASGAYLDLAAGSAAFRRVAALS